MKFKDYYLESLLESGGLDHSFIVLSEKKMSPEMMAAAKKLKVDYKDGEKNWWEELGKWIFTINIPGKETTFAASNPEELEKKYNQKIKEYKE